MFIFMEASMAATGSSAIISFGRVISARAMDTRWSSPPENWVGYFPLTTSRDMPTLFNASSTSLSASCLFLAMPRRRAVLYR